MLEGFSKENTPGRPLALIKCPPSCLKCCAELAAIFTQIFKKSLRLSKVPSCFKQSIIFPVPKKACNSSLNDYRAVNAMFSVVMKCFERLVLAYLKVVIGSLLDPFQFAYRANRSVEDAQNMGLHTLRGLMHAFSFWILEQLSIQPSLIFIILNSVSLLCQILSNWITNFLTDRVQKVKLVVFTSSTSTLCIGAPQGCMLSPLLFSIYTNNHTTSDSCQVLKI